jgi:hypothetical protein
LKQEDGHDRKIKEEAGSDPGLSFSAPFVRYAVIVREGGRSSTPRLLDSITDSCVYWMPAFAGMTTPGAIQSGAGRWIASSLRSSQ